MPDIKLLAKTSKITPRTSQIKANTVSPKNIKIQNQSNPVLPQQPINSLNITQIKTPIEASTSTSNKNIEIKDSSSKTKYKFFKAIGNAIKSGAKGGYNIFSWIFNKAVTGLSMLARSLPLIGFPLTVICVALYIPAKILEVAFGAIGGFLGGLGAGIIKIPYALIRKIFS